MMVNPRATYRIQLNSGFKFRDAARLAPYLAKLGVSHLYCSPILQATPGSKHGYDVVNHNKINEELGGAKAYGKLCETLKRYNMSLIIDVVPNHMAISGLENPWWWDVLENGQSSQYAAYFDVDWDPPQSRYSNLVVLPVLGDHYGRVLEAGELKLRHKKGKFTIHYYNHMFPVDPRSLSSLLEQAAKLCESDELAFLAGAFSKLPLATATDSDSVQKRHRDKEILLGMLSKLCVKQSSVLSAIDEVVNDINNDPDVFDDLAGQQNYRLAFWRMAERDIGYRRFFDINNLIGLCVESMRVFEDTHRLLFGLIDCGMTTGLRIDHPDGLRNPEQYFQNLKQACPNTWILAEKILEYNEEIRESWSVDGTTGYDFLNCVNGLFIDPKGEKAFTEFYASFTNDSTDFKMLAHEKKHQIMREILGSDVNRLTGLLLRICERHRRFRDYTRNQLQQALQEIAANFPIYRTYIRAEAGQITNIDIQYIKYAIKAAKKHNQDLAEDIFDFIRDLLFLRIQGEVENEFVMHFQQFTAPVMAKGIEDTSFYCFNRLISLNEVGGDPSRFGISVKEFHAHCTYKQKKWPITMLSSSTHDTKRSEDVRARLNLLSEIPEQWKIAVLHWSELNNMHIRNGYPDRNTEYLIYQTMIGAWPISEERLTLYMEKSIREAKVFTSWTHPNKEYEKSLKSFIKKIYKSKRFFADLESFVEQLIEPGRINSLSQTLLKLTAPGIPDIYQGTELWDLSLVDPDNRRPVNYDIRRKNIDKLNHINHEKVLKGMDQGLPKLLVIKETLAYRAEYPDLFDAKSNYKSLEATGKKADHVIAFMRGDNIITVVPRLILKLKEGWFDTKLKIPSGNWLNRFTAESMQGGDIPVSELFSRFPVCLLSKEDNEA